MNPELERLLIDSINARKIPDKELYKIIEDVQKKQEEILARKYVDINRLRNTYITI